MYAFAFSATSAAGLPLRAVSGRTAVAIGGVAELVLLAQPAAAQSGDPLPSIPVQLRDQGGNPLQATSGQSITAVVSKGGGTFAAGATTVVAASLTNGVATFENLALDLAAGDPLHELKFQFGSVQATSNPFLVHKAPAGLALATFPSDNATAGAPLAQQPVVHIVDDLGTRAFAAPDGTYTVTATVAGQPGLLGGTTSAVAARGAAVFTDLALRGEGLWEITFSDGINTVASGKVLVVPGAPAAVSIVEPYQPGLNGSNFAGLPLLVQPRVRVSDVGGSVPAAAPLMVEARIAQMPPGLPPDAKPLVYGTRAAAVDPATGEAAFTDLALNLAGAYTLAFSYAHLSAESLPLTIIPGEIAQLAYLLQPSPALFGEPLAVQPRLALLDLGGNRARGTPWLHLHMTLGAASSLQGCFEAHAAPDSGEVAFQGCAVHCAFEGCTSGPHTLTAYTSKFGVFAEATGTLTLESDPFQVSGPPERLALLSPPRAAATAAEPLPEPPQVQLLDASGAPVHAMAANARVRLAGAPLGNSSFAQLRAGAALAGIDSVPLAAGAAAFPGLSVAAAGNYSLLLAVPNGTGFFNASMLLSVSPGVAASIALTGLPAVVVAGEPLTPDNASHSKLWPQVAVADAHGNPIPDARSLRVAVDAACAAPPPPGADCAALGGGPRRVEGSRAVFEGLRVLVAGAANVTFTLMHHGHVAPIQAALAVAPAPAVRLLFTAQPPPAALAGAPMEPPPALRALDAYGNVAAGWAAPVRADLLLAPHPSVSLAGPGAWNASGGTVQLLAVAVDAPGYGYRLRVSADPAGAGAPALEATSEPFAVHTPYCCARLAAFPAVALGGAPLAPQPVVDVVDEGEALALSGRYTVRAYVEGGTATLFGTAEVRSERGGRALYRPRPRCGRAALDRLRAAGARRHGGRAHRARGRGRARWPAGPPRRRAAAGGGGDVRRPALLAAGGARARRGRQRRGQRGSRYGLRRGGCGRADSRARLGAGGRRGRRRALLRPGGRRRWGRSRAPLLCAWAAARRRRAAAGR